jgi:mannose/fructose-specific phosphotransferase system component IIA
MSEGGVGGEGVPVRGILFAHGAMAEGMVDALRKIAGAPEDALVALSNEGKGPEYLTQEVDRLAGSTPAIVFTDLPAGSCTMAARLSCRGKGQRAVVCGVNLPMLLDFVFHREMELDELVERLVATGRKALLHVPTPDGGGPP